MISWWECASLRPMGSEKYIEYHESQRIDSLTEDDFNALPFGAIKLDSDGRILKYNLYESQLAQRDPQGSNRAEFLYRCGPLTPTFRNLPGVTVREWQMEN